MSKKLLQEKARSWRSSQPLCTNLLLNTWSLSFVLPANTGIPGDSVKQYGRVLSTVHWKP